MNKLIIIGNGFDLAHNLKTKYTDFMLWYLNSLFQELTNKQSFEDSLITLRKTYLNTSIPKEFITIKEFKDYINLNEVSIKYKNNFFQDLLSKTEEQNWVDIESEYYFSLLTFYKALEKGNLERHKTIDDNVKELNICFNVLKDKLSEYLTEIESSSKSTNPDIESLFKKEFEFKNSRTSENNMFLNFNYTSTIENYSEVLKKR